MALVYENVLTQEQQNTIENIVTNVRFPWNVLAKTVLHSEEIVDDNIYDDFPVLFHMCYEKGSQAISPFFPLFKQVLLDFCASQDIKDVEILRIRVNMYFQAGMKPEQYTTPHIDTYRNDETTDTDFIVLIYYIMDSDGPTVLFKGHPEYHIEQKIHPKKGRFIMFRNKRHAGSFPIHHKIRAVINFNFRSSNLSNLDKEFSADYKM